MADPSSAPLPDGDAPTPQHDATTAADAIVTNGTTNGSVDVEMKEETPAEVQPPVAHQSPAILCPK